MSIRPAALAAFDLQEDELSTDLVVSQAAVVDRGWMDHQEQPVDQNAPEADRRNVPEEVISVSDGVHHRRMQQPSQLQHHEQ